ncbi:MAG: GH92 family glycosyl hydrolase [Tannerella sp.]|jgi:predicted alpha-1,2-mannosidase|nr:GH92 family glycosyl hydrolase [Tannerella sp.]
MKKVILSYILCMATWPYTFAQPEPTPADLADPLINTAECRFDFFASATVPFGMVALSPDTKHGDLWKSGYQWGNSHILNFSHVHNAQTAGIPVMPVTGACKGHLGPEANKSRFSHADEIARPGYHKVYLEDNRITAELTATCRVGMHRYTFPEAREVHLLFDLGAALGPVKMDYAYVRQTGPNEIEGYSIQAPTFRRKKPVAVYFVAQVSRPFERFAGWQIPESGQAGDFVEPENGIIRGKGCGAYLTYRHLKAGDTLLLKVALSYVSIPNARRNLSAELPHWEFDRVADDARDAWNDYLGRFRIEGGTHEQQVKFYTDLMHTAIGKRIAHDTDGSYTDCTGLLPVVRQLPMSGDKPAYAFLEGDGLWGSQWNLNILWSLVYPEYGNWMAETFLEYYRNAGMMARCSWGGNYSYVMVGDHSTPLLAALIATGRARFDRELAYTAARKNAFPGGIRDRAGYEAGENPSGGGIDWYIEYGYVPVEIKDRGDGFHRGGTAMTLEYAYQDWCIAQMAKQLGKTDDAALFAARAENWRNVFDPVSGWMRPRLKAGGWLEPFSPVAEGNDFNTVGFIEGNSATYSFYVPQNIPGLIEAMGGSRKFAEKLNAGFEKAKPFRFVTPHGEHGKGWVDYENQPSCEMAHLFSHAGMPWLTQYWVRQVKDIAFGATDPYGGYNGDEDQGQMGALGVLMAAGLFNLQGCAAEEPMLEITSPVFDRMTISFPAPGDATRQNVFEITVKRQRPTDIYIRQVRLNGRPHHDFRFPAAVFLEGGTLEIELGATPNKKWGRK